MPGPTRNCRLKKAQNPPKRHVLESAGAAGAPVLASGKAKNRDLRQRCQAEGRLCWTKSWEDVSSLHAGSKQAKEAAASHHGTGERRRAGHR